MMRAILPLLLALPLVASAQSPVPGRIGFTGRLMSSDGTAVTGRITLTFSLYDVESGGTSTWTDTQNLLLSFEGAYGTYLEIPESALLAPGTRYLELTVGSEPPLSPRLELGATPYAVVAKHVKGGTVDATSISLNGVPLSMGGGGFTTMKSFTSNGTLVVPQGVTRLHVRAWGGGGAGGTVDSAASKPGGGGGAGGYAEDILEVVPGNSVTFTVGMGGTASACTANNGGDTLVSVQGLQQLIARGGQAGEHPQGATCCTSGKPTPKGGMGGMATGGIALAGENGWDASEGGGAGLNAMSPVFGRGGETVFNPLIPCTPGDSGKSGLVLVAY